MLAHEKIVRIPDGAMLAMSGFDCGECLYFCGRELEVARAARNMTQDEADALA